MPDKRNFGDEKQGCNRTCPGMGEKGRLLLQPLFGSKSDGRVSTCLEPETIKPVYCKENFQNGNTPFNSEICAFRGLGVYPRSKRCLLSHTNFSQTQEVSSLRVPRSKVPVPGPSFRSVFGSENFYKSRKGCSDKIEKRRYSCARIPGRLDSSGRLSRGVNCSQKSSDCVAPVSGFGSQCQKVAVGANPSPGISGGQVGSENRYGVSLSKESGIAFVHPSKDKSPRLPSSSPFISAGIGADELLYRPHPICSFEDETFTVVSSCSLVTKDFGPRREDSDKMPPVRTCSVVGGYSQPSEGLSVPCQLPVGSSLNRCVPSGLGSTFSDSSSVRKVADAGQGEAYQLAGTQSCLFGLNIPVRITPRPECHGSHRQFNCSSIYKQRRGYTVPDPLLPSVGDSIVVCETQCDPSLLSYSREDQPFSRYAQQEGQNFSNRVDSKPICPAGNIQFMGDPSDRPFCNSYEPSSSSVCFPNTRLSSPISGCHGIQLVGDVSVCLSTVQPNSVSNSEVEGIRELYTGPVGTSLDRQSMVSGPASCEESRSNNLIGKDRSVEATPQQTDISPGGKSAISSVAIVKNTLMAAGFSSDTAARAAASCRDSTVKSYDLKLRVFFDWANDHGVDPFKATLPQIADFLEFLFTARGLAPRTIRSYRSAVSKVHPGWNGLPVGRNKVLSDMISAFFISRPPVRKLVPNWSLQLVLLKLCDLPFEPLAKADLKWLTLKTVFLVAVASGRRVSSLHALSVGEGHLRENQSGTTLIPSPGFLAKNESINYMAKSICFTKMSRVSSVPEDRLLCPCRALSHYVKRSSEIRGGKQHLFLTYGRKDHRAASRDTLARWIVEVIKYAYDSSSSQDFRLASAHDTRSISTSWALLEGVPLQDILEAASWKTESTFTAYYVRDMVASRSDFSRTVIAAAAK